MPHLLSTLAIPPAPAVLDTVYVHTPVLVYVHVPVWPVGGLCDRSSWFFEGLLRQCLT